MKIALLQEKQNELYQFNKPEIRYTQEQAKIYQQKMIMRNLDMMREATQAGCDLIVTSEAFNFAGQPCKVEGDYAALIPDLDDGLFAQLSEIAREGHCYVAAGVFRKEETSAGNKLYNSILLYDREGKLCNIYDKVHLAGDENDYLTRGNQYCVVETDFGKLGMAICWDMQFPETCQTLADMDADLIIAPTWGWEWIYGPCRAYENGIYVASAMAVPYYMPIEGLRSPSEVIGPEGDILAGGSREEAQIVICEIPDIRNCVSHREMRRSCRRPNVRD